MVTKYSKKKERRASKNKIEKDWGKRKEDGWEIQNKKRERNINFYLNYFSDLHIHSEIWDWKVKIKIHEKN